MMKYVLMLALFFAGYATAEDAAVREQVMTAKEAVLELNRDLYELERELLSPATTRAAFHITLNHGEYFEPLAVELSVDGQLELQHLYTERQVKALRMGAVQPLGDLNLAPGKHDISVTIRGVDHQGQGRELAITETVSKTGKPLIVELLIVDREELQSARLQLKYW
ncbi:MAG: hypothetical protein CSH37_06230 [Thalassolituus sp.]|jgi:hypothetical protein|uniref:AraC family transcriptional regulator n=2 Tax=Oceanospirillaceae TaxID=135620 RepID=A0ABP9ZZF5_9GAMM|nr:MAG: hypothetical protein CSH37_06230 [Thalassolituus sp.]|tara:strand:+ start:181 stop:681 length:501 start_codon:yes stop_codon:yes gene_type:complete